MVHGCDIDGEVEPFPYLLTYLLTYLQLVTVREADNN